MFIWGASNFTFQTLIGKEKHAFFLLKDLGEKILTTKGVKTPNTGKQWIMKVKRVSFIKMKRLFTFIYPLSSQGLGNLAILIPFNAEKT